MARAPAADPMPAMLCFDRAGEETMQALADLRRSLHRGRRTARREAALRQTRAAVRNMGSHRPLHTIREITPAAALVLAAEYDRRLQRGRKPAWVIDDQTWDPAVRDTLAEIGLFRVVGFPDTPPRAGVNPDRVVLPMRSGNTVDPGAIARLVDDLRPLCPDPDGTGAESLFHLYGAMLEAILNVVSHAYPDGGTYEFQPVRRWWMTGAVDRSAGSITTVIFDQGVTIPVSLPRWHRYAAVQQRITVAMGQLLNTMLGSSLGIPTASDVRSDAFAIAAAVEESVSSTEQANRGTGLAQMREFVNQCRRGRLRIISRNGEVVFRPGVSPALRQFDVSIGGTLIELSVIL